MRCIKEGSGVNSSNGHIMAGYAAFVVVVLLAAIGVASAVTGAPFKRHENCTHQPTLEDCGDGGIGPHYFFNSTEKRCKRTLQNQCSTGANGFKTMSSCAKNCNPKLGPGRCKKLIIPQSCLTSSQPLVSRWQYNTTTGQCTLRHICKWSRGNVFSSLSDCMERCSGFDDKRAVNDTSGKWPFTMMNTEYKFE